MSHCRKTQLTVFLTNGCTLDCIYCYAKEERKHHAQVIDLSFAKRAIMDYFKNYSSREIRFFGSGEPTTPLAFSRMKEIRDWSYETSNGTATYELQTNGYFSNSVACWIKENINTVWVSCDGPPEIQDFYRPAMNGFKSSLLVEKNIKRLSGSALTLGCRMTIGSRNVRVQKQTIDYFDSLGVRYVMSDPLFSPIRENGESLLAGEDLDLMEYAEYFLQARDYADSKGMFYGSIFTVNFDEPTEYHCRSCIPYPHLTMDGYVSCCDMAYSGSNKEMNALIYGRYLADSDEIVYDVDKMEVIKSRKASNMINCVGCEVLHNCAGSCVGEALNETGDIFGVKPKVCEVVRFLSRNSKLNSGLYPILHP